MPSVNQMLGIVLLLTFVLLIGFFGYISYGTLGIIFSQFDNLRGHVLGNNTQANAAYTNDVTGSSVALIIIITGIIVAVLGVLVYALFKSRRNPQYGQSSGWA